ncbi:uncharacterized protein JCM6883_006438 [Sporobolomyces salmoneus]|uniref:uncharacterized protein n=1 Tax=Sporobolomyces salmoneus TaxID=183962 RepID=UPI00318272A2
MTTPPTSNSIPPVVSHSGPAWTRNPKSSPKKQHKSRTTGTPYAQATGAASSTSSISLLNPQASTSSLSLPQQNEAPYLTHKQRYHGQLTLVAPDNLGARRQAGTVDAPETRVDARGGFGVTGMMREENENREQGEAEGEAGDEDEETTRKIRKKVKKKKKKEEEQLRQRQIMAAVSNAGRTPSPNSNAPRQTQQSSATTAGTVGAQPGGPNEMARSASGQAMLASDAPLPAQSTQSRLTAQAPPTSTPSNASAPSRRTRPSRPIPNPSSTSSQPPTSHRRSLSPSYMPPPSLDDSSLDNQISLGLVDPSLLLSPPPPAYDPPPPSISTLPTEPPPPISVPSANPTPRQPVSASSTVDSEEDEEEEEDDDSPPDPLVLAWEDDRLTGLYSLDERIARDLERRRAADEALLSVSGEGTPSSVIDEEEEVEVEEVPGQGEDDLNEIRQAEASRDSRRLSRALSRHASRRYGAGSRRSTMLMSSSTGGLSALRENRPVEESTETSRSQGPSPAPSPSAEQTLPSSSLPTVVEPQTTPTTISLPRSPRFEQDSNSLTIAEETTSSIPPPLMSPAESSAIAAEFPSPSPSQGSPSLSNSPYISETEDDRPDVPVPPTKPTGDDPRSEESEEEEEEEEDETEEQALARKVTRSGRGLAALAAERRLRMEREEKEREERGLDTPVVEEEEEPEEAVQGETSKREEQVESTVSPQPTTEQPTVSSPSTSSRLDNPRTMRREPSLPDFELSFSQPSSRSSLPRPAPPPQLVPLEPESTPILTQSPAVVAASSSRSIPPPVPARRSIARRSLQDQIPSTATTSTLERESSGRRVPPPPPPSREVGHRNSVRSIVAALNEATPPSSPRRRVPSPSSRSIPVSTVRNRPVSIDSVSINSASTCPPSSSLTGPRPVPPSRVIPSLAPRDPVNHSPSLSSSLPASFERPTNSSAPRRPRPLPVPPAPLSQDRIDAFTALRAVQGNLSPIHDSPSLPNVNLSSSVSTPSTSAAVRVRPTLQPRRSTSSSSSSVENPGPPLPRRPPAQQPEPEQLSAYTDLDLLLARLEGDAASSREAEATSTEGGTAGEGGESGRNYDDLLTLGELMGNVAPAGASAEEIAEHLTVARVELERRRIDKRGKVKTKLSVVGVRCVDCSICMSRFKVDDFAVVLSNCLHIFHEKCIRTWFHRSRQCPVCRAQVFPPRPLVDLTAP